MLTFLAQLDPVTRVIVVFLVVAGIYLGSVWRWPYTSCPACSGGQRPSPWGNNHRSCGRCNGTGRKLRVIARLLGRTDP
uniref:hypothetical protein n=1 Tax=Amycolatopsis sp. CA-096443 TaxID=3239919 RepID=UPI003F499311